MEGEIRAIDRWLWARRDTDCWKIRQDSMDRIEVKQSKLERKRKD